MVESAEGYVVGASILVAEDDAKHADLVRMYLEREGHAVLLVRDGTSALAAARRHAPDVVVLDVMLPGLDGLEVSRMLRSESEVPVLLLTARSTEEDLLQGFEAGADDYLTKPYSPRELMARVRVLLRRAAHTTQAAGLLRVGALTVDLARFEVQLGQRTGQLTAREFAVLTLLAGAPGQAFTRRQILERAFDSAHASVQERSVDTHVMNPRRKLEAQLGVQLIETVYGRGYRLDEEACAG